MNDKKMEYIKQNNNYARVIRTEILLTPLLIIVPIIVSFFLIYDWYTRGFLENNTDFNAQLVLGIIILIGNILFDIPFMKSLRDLAKKKEK